MFSDYNGKLPKPSVISLADYKKEMFKRWKDFQDFKKKFKVGDCFVNYGNSWYERIDELNDFSVSTTSISKETNKRFADSYSPWPSFHYQGAKKYSPKKK